MNKSYEKPIMVVENFTAQEFIAACGDSGVNYLFDCNAPKGSLYYFPKSDGNLDGTYTGSDEAEFIGDSFHPCGAKHETNNNGDFYEGFVDYNKDGEYTYGKNVDERVIVWRVMEWDEDKEKNRLNSHATNKLNMQSWETQKS